MSGYAIGSFVDGLVSGLDTADRLDDRRTRRQREKEEYDRRVEARRREDAARQRALDATVNARGAVPPPAIAAAAKVGEPGSEASGVERPAVKRSPPPPRPALRDRTVPAPPPRPDRASEDADGSGNPLEFMEPFFRFGRLISGQPEPGEQPLPPRRPSQDAAGSPLPPKRPAPPDEKSPPATLEGSRASDRREPGIGEPPPPRPSAQRSSLDPLDVLDPVLRLGESVNDFLVGRARAAVDVAPDAQSERGPVVRNRRSARRDGRALRPTLARDPDAEPPEPPARPDAPEPEAETPRPVADRRAMRRPAGRGVQPPPARPVDERGLPPLPPARRPQNEPPQGAESSPPAPSPIVVPDNARPTTAIDAPPTVVAPSARQEGRNYLYGSAMNLPPTPNSPENMSQSDLPSVQAAGAAVEAAVSADDRGRGVAPKVTPDRAATAQASFIDTYMRVGAPIMIEHFLAEGDVEKAQKFNDFVTSAQTRTAMKHWSRAAFAAGVGDIDTFTDAIADAYNAAGYFDDDMEIVKSKSAVVRDGDGAPAGARITIREKTSGKTFEHVFDDLDDMLQFGVSMLAPEKAFDYYMQKQGAAQSLQAKAAVEAMKESLRRGRGDGARADEAAENRLKRIDGIAETILDASADALGKPSMTYEDARRRAEEIVDGKRAGPTLGSGVAGRPPGGATDDFMGG